MISSAGTASDNRAGDNLEKEIGEKFF